MKKAVALKYPEGVVAPIIVAKGNGFVADKIVSEARKNEIPVKNDEILVDMIGISEIGDPVPECAWEAIAKIFSFILENKK